jgi:putative flippase GtrA
MDLLSGRTDYLISPARARFALSERMVLAGHSGCPMRACSRLATEPGTLDGVSLGSDAAGRLLVRRVETRSLSSLPPSTKYLVVGLVCTAIDFALFNALAFHFNAPRTSAKFLSTGIAIVVSFLLNRAWTFRDATSANWRQQFALYVVINVASTALSVICMKEAVLHGMTGQLWANIAAFGVVLTVGTVARFLIYRRFVFR